MIMDVAIGTEVPDPVLMEGLDHHLLDFFPFTTLAFLPVADEEFLVAEK